jgi:hypothetical protein
VHSDPSKFLIRSFTPPGRLRTWSYLSEQTENDWLKKAVREAEAPKDAIIAQLKGENDKLNHDRLIDETNLRELSRLNNEFKRKNLDLAAHHSRVEVMEEIHQKTNQELHIYRLRLLIWKLWWNESLEDSEWLIPCGEDIACSYKGKVQLLLAWDGIYTNTRFNAIQEPIVDLPWAI